MTDHDRDLQANGAIEPLLSIEEVAEVLRISESGVYRLIRRGEICCVKVGSRTLIEPVEIRGFIAQQRQSAEAEAQSAQTRKEAA